MTTNPSSKLIITSLAPALMFREDSQMPSHVLKKLKSLQYKRCETSPFESHTAFREWADRVTPLLGFDKGTQVAFKSSICTAELQNEMSGVEYPVRAVNEAIGIMNQATMALELLERETDASLVRASGPKLPSATLESPPKVTIKWLIDHLPVRHVTAGVTALVAAFVLGLAFSETPMYALLRSKAPKVSNVTNGANAAVTSSKPISSHNMTSLLK